MNPEELINILKENNLSLYTTINDNFEKITKEQLRDIILSLALQIPNYINSPTILKHFYNDLIEDLNTFYSSNSTNNTERSWKYHENISI